jgi:hypothetical protein
MRVRNLVTKRVLVPTSSLERVISTPMQNLKPRIACKGSRALPPFPLMRISGAQMSQMEEKTMVIWRPRQRISSESLELQLVMI